MKLRKLALACALAIALPIATRAAETDVDNTGIKIGEKAPLFALKDQSGKERKLDEFLKNGKVAIVFYRSASW
jgi:hypothetical protein